jgi:hypothetical protein
MLAAVIKTLGTIPGKATTMLTASEIKIAAFGYSLKMVRICSFKRLNQCFACSETSAFKYRHLFVILIGNGDEIKPCTLSIVYFFGFSR